MTDSNDTAIAAAIIAIGLIGAVGLYIMWQQSKPTPYTVKWDYDKDGRLVGQYYMPMPPVR